MLGLPRYRTSEDIKRALVEEATPIVDRWCDRTAPWPNDLFFEGMHFAITALLERRCTIEGADGYPVRLVFVEEIESLEKVVEAAKEMGKRFL